MGLAVQSQGLCGAWRQDSLWKFLPSLGLIPSLTLDSHVAFRSPSSFVSLSFLICRIETAARHMF